MVTAEGQARVAIMPGAQEGFFLSGARHPALISGRGGGKTVGLVAQRFAYADRYPGARGLLTEPTFDMIRRNLVPVIEELFGVANPAHWEFAGYQQSTPTIVRMRNGSTFDLRPAEEAGRFRGATYAHFGLDEIREGNQLETFMTLLPCLRQPGYPHQGSVATTPDGGQPWIRQVWVEKVNPLTGAPLTALEYPYWQAHTEDNIYLTEEDKRHWRELYGETRLAAQELGGQFLLLQGAAFPEFSEGTHVRHPPVNIHWRRSLVGMDFGATSPTALIEVCQDEGNRLWAVREFYQANCQDRQWVMAAVEWETKRIVCDPSGGERKLQLLRDVYGMPLFSARSNEFALRARLVASRLALQHDGLPGLFISPQCRNLIAELKNLAYAEAKLGQPPQDRWESGCMDHAYDALAYAVMDYDRPPHDFGYRPKVRVKGWSW